MSIRENIRSFRHRLLRRRRLRDVTPKGLFGRSLLIIALPVALMQIIVLWMFFDSQWETVTRRLSEGVAGDVAMIVAQAEAKADNDDFAKLAQLAQEKMGLSVVLQSQGSLPTNLRASVFSVLDRTLREALEAKLQNPFWFDTTRYPAYVDIRVQSDAGVLRFIAPRDKVFSTTGHIFVFWLLVATFLQTTIAIIFIRNQVRPIQRLAIAAEHFGKGQENTGYSPSGAREVRQAGAAFLQMKDRIERFVNQRTEMLAGVSHDLRTPLTRLKLQLAMLEQDGDIKNAQQDLRDMERMLDGYLSFARSGSQEDSVTVDMNDLVQTCVDKAKRGGADIEIMQDGGMAVFGRKDALGRCLSNLIDNAVRYGGKVFITTQITDNGVEVMIEDNGPGIEQSRHEAAFMPFNRLDPARNANTDGVGLGLSIARDIARAHGGDIILGRSSYGGLSVCLTIPSPNN